MTTLTLNMAGAGWMGTAPARTARTARMAHRGAPRGGRGRRVKLLLGAVVLLSGLDLVMTLALMASHGMYEANPIVVLLVRWTNSPAAIVLCKAASVAFAAGVLYRIRHHWQAEVGAWLAAAILCGLGAQWVRYTATVADLEPGAMLSMAADDPNWLVLD